MIIQTKNEILNDEAIQALLINSYTYNFRCSFGDIVHGL